MALVDVAPFIWPGGNTHGFASGLITAAICDVTGEKCAFCGLIPSTGAISRVGIKLGAVTNANAATQITVSLQTLDADGHPSGTLLDAANGQWQRTGASILTANAWTWFDFTDVTYGSGAAAVAKGDPFAVVFEMTVRGGADSVTVQGVDVNIRSRMNLPYVDLYTAAWAKTANAAVAPNVVLEYASSAYVVAPEFGGISNTSVSANNEEKGARFRLPFPARIAGLIDYLLYTKASGQTSFQRHLIADATSPGGVRLASTADIDSDLSDNPTTVNASGIIRFATPYEAAAGTWYRATCTGTGVHGILYSRNVESNALLTQVLGTTDFYWCDDNGSGGWTDVDSEFPTLRLVIDQLDDGSGGGGGGGGLITHPGMAGGMRG